MSSELRQALFEAAGELRELPDVPAITRRGRELRWRKRVVRLSAVCLLIVLVVLVSTQLDAFRSEALPPAERPRLRIPVLEPSEALGVGRYSVDVFESPFAVTVSSARWFTGTVSPTWVDLTRRGLHLHVQRWGRVVTIQGGRRSASPMPVDLMGWFGSAPNLEILSQNPVTVGGLSGTRLDIEVSRPPRPYPSECEGERCLVVARVASHGEPVDIAVHERARFYVLDNEAGPLVIHWRAGSRRFGRVAPIMDEVVRSIDFLDR